MSLRLEARFEKYCDTIMNTTMHADREHPARWRIKGLMPSQNLKWKISTDSGSPVFAQTLTIRTLLNRLLLEIKNFCDKLTDAPIRT